MTILLASTSPQRRAILEQLGIPFEIVAPGYLEEDQPGLDPIALVRAHALGKAHSVAEAREDRAGKLVLGVDTAVSLDRRIYGKPADREEAREMLQALSGCTHEVVSGLCLLGDGWQELHHSTTRVGFRTLSEPEVEWYLATDEWRGRAGAYAIQARGATLVERIEGDYLNVVGLPAALLVRLLAERVPGSFGLG
jgi:septum formation protein